MSRFFRKKAGRRAVFFICIYVFAFLPSRLSCIKICKQDSACLHISVSLTFLYAYMVIVSALIPLFMRSRDLYGHSSYSERHFLGHLSTHAPHLTHASSSTFQTFSFLSTVKASQGQFFAQSPQYTHTSRSHVSLSSPDAASAFFCRFVRCLFRFRLLDLDIY